MYVKVDKQSLAILLVSESPLQQDEYSVVIQDNTITTTNPDYIQVWRENGQIKVRELSDEEKQFVDQVKLQEAKSKALESLDKFTQKYIEYFYPQIKQRSDMHDKDFWTTFLVNKQNLAADDIANKVYNSSASILDGSSTLQDEVNKYSLDSNGNQITVEWAGQTVPISIAWEQLIKVGVRTGWVQLVKNKYRQIKLQIENAQSIDQIPLVPDVSILSNQSLLQNIGIYPLFPGI